MAASPDQGRGQSLVKPLEGAVMARARVRDAVDAGVSARIKLPAPVAACFLGIPADTIQNLRLVVDPQPDGSLLLTAGSRASLKTAVAQLSHTKQPEVEVAFNVAAYCSLYEWVAADAVGQARGPSFGAGGLYADVLAEGGEFPFLVGMTTYVRRHGAFMEEDKPPLAGLLVDFWGRLPAEWQHTLASMNIHLYNPFQTPSR